jgi:hypothetical protein
VIDFGDLLRTWRIADLSVTCAALLHHAEGDPLRICRRCRLPRRQPADRCRTWRLAAAAAPPCWC